MNHDELNDHIRKNLSINADLSWAYDDRLDPVLQLEIGLRIDGITFNDVKLSIQMPSELLNNCVDADKHR
ncbi:hypothetical protein [Stenotrophomonas phage RAS14]